jgi:hypothetical protein
MQFVEIDPKGTPSTPAGRLTWTWRPSAPADLALIEDVLAAPWIARTWSRWRWPTPPRTWCPSTSTRCARREKTVDKTLAAVHERLVKEINFWSDRYIKLQDDIAAGKDVRLTLENVRRTIDDLTARRESREKELLAMRHVVSATPVVWAARWSSPRAC